MAKADVKIVDSGGYNEVPVKTFKVQDRDTSSDTVIYPGEPVKMNAGEDGNYATHLAGGDPEMGTDIVIGIAASESTETSSAVGEVDVYLPLPGIIYRCDAKTGSNLAEGILLDTVTFDLDTKVYTVDEDEGSDEDVHGLRIIDYDADNDTVDFMFKSGATILDDSVS